MQIVVRRSRRLTTMWNVEVLRLCINNSLETLMFMLGDNRTRGMVLYSPKSSPSHTDGPSEPFFLAVESLKVPTVVLPLQKRGASVPCSERKKQGQGRARSGRTRVSQHFLPTAELLPRRRDWAVNNNNDARLTLYTTTGTTFGFAATSG